MVVLSRSLRDCVNVPHFSFHPQCSRLKLNHLIFADDLLIFMRGDLPSVAAVMNALSLFAGFSGLQANLDRMSIYFGGVSTTVRQQILEFAHLAEGAFPFKYLGVPLTSGRLKLCHYGPLIDMMVKKVLHWTNCFLSHAGKLQLIDSVLSSQLVYWCSVFLLPKGVIHQLESVFRDFYWGSGEDHGKIHWLKWDFFTRPKMEGGVGIKEILSWNKALLLKWVWKLTVGAPSLWLNWVEAYLLKRQSLWSVRSKSFDPWVWQEILKVRDDFGLCGEKFCTLAAYHFLRDGGIQVQRLACIWETFALPKHRVVCWTAYHGRLATIDNLQKRGFCFVNRCFLCKQDAESHGHLFFRYTYVCQLWRDLMREIEWLYSHCLWRGLPGRIQTMLLVAIVYHKHDVSFVCNEIRFELACRCQRFCPS
ncbi:hypothetical protein RND81_05G013500 [Saponaria officinalis]|uniref:Reverse transcriptase zinc-binding domain-containing protein n=1 Tax=Saponaria officinalis TaxID=3572 RepID=A0AAW1KTE4_SAPOF